MEFTQEQKLYAEIVQKAWEDASFKQELMTNPIVTISAYNFCSCVNSILIYFD